MPSDEGARPAGVKRVVFKEIVDGDLRKFEAQSNDADTGGGARDLRFRPSAEFEPVFRKLFPAVRREPRRRDGRRVEEEVLVGEFHWLDNGHHKRAEATYEMPTTARPGEGRVPVVHKYPPFTRELPRNEGRLVALLVQRDDGTVWPEFATEDSLRSGSWHTGISAPILRSLDAKRPASQVARGFIDFDPPREFSDA